MILAVVGSRTWSDRERVFAEIAKANPSEIVSGGAVGPDSFAEEWARQNNIPVTVFKPDWDKHGKSAGFVRNKQIIDKADYVLAFWDGKSRGTAHSISLAKKARKFLYVIEPLKQSPKEAKEE